MRCTTENDFKTAQLSSLEVSNRNIVSYTIYRHCLTTVFNSSNNL